MVYLDPNEIALIAKAYLVAANAHETQFRSSGEPYITHPVNVAEILADLHMDPQMIQAALLHDVIEDTPVTKEDIENQFGKKISDLVEGVTKLTQIKFQTKAEAQAENFRKMVLAMVEDIRVIIIKLADRLHNMRTLGALRPDKKRRIALETIEIYAPIANRLGMNNFKVELEGLGFEALHPMRHRVLKMCVRKARGNRKKLLEKIKKSILNKLREEEIKHPQVWGREKRLFSIYRKMRDKGLPFSEIMDVYAFRIIAEDRHDCYRMLGIAHSLYTPVPGRFKDYIAIPKTNGYQSLHTTLFGPYGVPIEIQIRTEEMEYHADNGIAAHWIYKEQPDAISNIEIKTRTWLSRVIDMQKGAHNPLEFIENVKIDLFPDEIYVFTPKGDIVELPMGSTVIDFAYSVHTEVGHHTISAKVNRRLVPLSFEIHNGQTIEILTSPTAVPNPAWMNFAVTGKAKSAIRHFIKSQQEGDAIQLGKKLLSYSLSEFNLKWDKIDKNIKKQLLKTFNLDHDDQLFIQIGTGERASAVICHQILETLDHKDTPMFNKQLEIEGSEGMQLEFGECCYPIPGDRIQGILRKGKGIEIHRTCCKKFKELEFKEQPERFVSIAWAQNTSGKYLVELSIELENYRGAIAAITTELAKQNTNIHQFNIQQADSYYGTLSILVDTTGRTHLAKVIRSIKRKPEVIHISRN